MDSCTTNALERLIVELAPASTIVALAIRKPPFPSIPKDVAAVHASYQLRCSADGMMYQQAFCRAAKRLKLAENDKTIQGFADGVFHERNSGK